MKVENNNNYYCYSVKQFHYLSAFGERCCASRNNNKNGKRYWVFKKSKRLDAIIDSYRQMKNKF